MLIQALFAEHVSNALSQEIQENTLIKKIVKPDKAFTLGT